MNTAKNVPELRFKEFNGEWEEKRLGDIGKFWKGKNISKDDLSDEGIECIRYGELYTTYKEKIEVVLNKTKLPLKELFVSKRNDILIPSSGETAIDISTSSCIIKDNVALGGDINIIRTQNDGIFLSYYLNYAKKQDIAKLAQGASIIHLYIAHLKTLKIKLPSISEQQKIVSFLTAVDKKIEIVDKKIEHLENYKKGLMQKLLTGEIRFPGFSGGWEEIILGKILKERKTYDFKNKNFEHLSLTTEGTLPKSERYNRDFLVNSSNKKYKITYKNDICYNPANLKFGVISKNNYGDGIFSPIYITFEVDSKFNINFISYFVTTKYFIDKALQYEQGTVYERMAVHPDDLLLIKIKIPLALEEQQKIASFLTAVDKKIELNKNKLENLKAYKKGLLQKMFV